MLCNRIHSSKGRWCAAAAPRGWVSRRPLVAPCWARQQDSEGPSTSSCSLQSKGELDPPPAFSRPQPVPHTPTTSSVLPKEQRDAARTLLLGAGLLGTGFSLEGPLSTLQALAVLAAIVAVHECGHFLAARVQGIRVSKFAIGFGPSLWSYKGPEVEYALNMIPLGGYVAFPDEDPAKAGELDQDDPNLLKNRSIASRAVVISAGVVANLIFALAVLFAQVTTVGKAETEYQQGVRIPKVNSNSAAARAGFQDGDVVIKVGDMQLAAAPEQVRKVVGAIQTSGGERMLFVVQRDGETFELPVIPDVGLDGKGKIGVSLNANVQIVHTKAESIGQAISMTGSEFKRLSTTVFNGLQALLTNMEKAMTNLSGPVAIVAAGSEIARTDVAGLFQFCAIVNINLAAVNVLPLPALDGGYMVLLFLEALRGGKKLPAKIEGAVMASGLLVLTAMGIGLVIKDTVGLIPL